MIELCLRGYDKLTDKKITTEIMNSTHVYEKLDIELSAAEFQQLVDYRDKPIADFLQTLGIEGQLRDILLYAIGFFTSNQTSALDQVTTFQFFERIQRYLRSIGLYGDSPMLTAVYGSSEYAQAFSRVGSLFGSTYVVNSEVDLQKLNLTADKQFESLEFNFNDTPLCTKKGIIVGTDYQDWVLSQSGLTPSAVWNSCRKVTLARMTLITRKPLCEET